MSEENVEFARRYVETFNARGLDGVEKFWHPEIELHDPPSFPDADHYSGKAAIRKRVESYIEAGWDGQFRDPEYIDAQDEVIVIWKARWELAPLEGTIGHVVQVEDGKVRRLRQFTSREEALESVGLSE
jgi:ketosteroid isomerase-like protein